MPHKSSHHAYHFPTFDLYAKFCNIHKCLNYSDTPLTFIFVKTLCAIVVILKMKSEVIQNIMNRNILDPSYKGTLTFVIFLNLHTILFRKSRQSQIHITINKQFSVLADKYFSTS